jgi:HK97 gp10 family phage protein
MIEGLDNLLRALGSLENLDFTGALQAGGDVLLDGAQQRVRVDTGELRDSLHTVVAQDTAVLETDNHHAAANEFGTAHMPAQSFMRATVDEDGDKAIAAIATVAGRQIVQVGQ